jgi:hypothetical protein
MMRGNKGVIFIIVMVMSMLMVFIAVSASNMLLQDVHMVKHLKYSTEAQYLAESGISDALATLVELGFPARTNPANFPQKNLGEGTYDVTVIESGTRVLLSSVGTVRGVSRTVALEVKDNTPTSLYYMMASGSDMMFRALLLGWANINGNMHSNRNLLLQALWAGWIDVDTCGSSCCDGRVSASGTVDVREGFAGNVTIHGNGGVPIEGAPPVTFPNFDYTYYKGLAQASGDYYSGNVVFRDQTLSPGNGIVYVEGTATFRGECHLNGGIVADRIEVLGDLNQHKSGTRNVIISRSQDIRIFNKLAAEEALVYAGGDFRVFNAGSIVSITGTLISARYLRMWDALTYITYNHRVLYPDGLVIGSGDVTIEIVSWNK